MIKITVKHRNQTTASTQTAQQQQHHLSTSNSQGVAQKSPNTSLNTSSSIEIKHNHSLSHFKHNNRESFVKMTPNLHTKSISLIINPAFGDPHAMAPSNGALEQQVGHEHANYHVRVSSTSNLNFKRRRSLTRLQQLKAKQQAFQLMIEQNRARLDSCGQDQDHEDTELDTTDYYAPNRAQDDEQDDDDDAFGPSEPQNNRQQQHHHHQLLAQRAPLNPVTKTIDELQPTPIPVPSVLELQSVVAEQAALIEFRRTGIFLRLISQEFMRSRRRTI